MSSCIKLILENGPTMSFTFTASVFTKKIYHATSKKYCEIKSFPIILKIREKEILNTAM